MFNRLVADGFLHKVPSQYYPEPCYAHRERTSPGRVPAETHDVVSLRAVEGLNWRHNDRADEQCQRLLTDEIERLRLMRLLDERRARRVEVLEAAIDEYYPEIDSGRLCDCVREAGCRGGEHCRRKAAAPAAGHCW